MTLLSTSRVLHPPIFKAKLWLLVAVVKLEIIFNCSDANGSTMVSMIPNDVQILGTV